MTKIECINIFEDSALMRCSVIFAHPRSDWLSGRFSNQAAVTTRRVVDCIQNRTFQFWESDADFYRDGAITPRSNCLLDVSKLLVTGVRLRPVGEALEAALKNWQPERWALNFELNC